MSRRRKWLRLSASVLAIGVGGAAAGCGAASVHSPTASLRPDQRPVPIGRGPDYRLTAVSPAVAHRTVVRGLHCTISHGPHYGVHLELYGGRLVLPLPAGIGIAPPQRRRGAYVLGGSCSYPVRTFEPTGVVIVDRGRPLDLGTLFALWGQSLSRRSLARFHGPVAAFVGGTRWNGDPSQIALRRHAEIVLEEGGLVLPHPSYTFPPGL